MSVPPAGAKLSANGLDGETLSREDLQALPKRPERGDEIELRIDSLAHGGEGVGRLGDTPSGAHGGGYVVFVSVKNGQLDPYHSRLVKSAAILP